MKRAENFERVQRERATFASWHAQPAPFQDRRPKTATELFLLLSRPSGWATGSEQRRQTWGENNYIFWHSSWKHSAPKTNTQSRSGSSEFIWLLSGSLSNVPVRPFTFVTHSGGGGAVSHVLRPLVPFRSGRSFPANVTYASLISHYRLASPRLLRDLITIKLTIFKPIIGLQTLIKAMHWF